MLLYCISALANLLLQNSLVVRFAKTNQRVRIYHMSALPIKKISILVSIYSGHRELTEAIEFAHVVIEMVLIIPIITLLLAYQELGTSQRPIT